LRLFDVGARRLGAAHQQVMLVGADAEGDVHAPGAKEKLLVLA
jgi:hypothetical protein